MEQKACMQAACTASKPTCTGYGGRCHKRGRTHCRQGLDDSCPFRTLGVAGLGEVGSEEDWGRSNALCQRVRFSAGS